jgi:hypothetical protein
MSSPVNGHELDDMQQKLFWIMEKYPETRNNDFYLIWLYLKYVEKLPLPYLSREKLNELSGITETIRRSRQIIQNERHLFPPTRKEVLTRRRQKEEDYHSYFAQLRARDLRKYEWRP